MHKSQTFAGSMVALLSLGVVACGSSSSPGPSSSGAELVFAGFNPFTGADASFGPNMMAGCWPGVLALNQAGGVLGHKFTCVGVDTRGDPADAVPAAEQLLATTPNLVGIIGPSSDEADATVPIFEQAKIPMFADTGEASFDRSSYKFFWRLTPADDVKGYAMALWAQQHGYSRAAAIFANDISSQSNVPTLVKAITKTGSTVVINERIADNQPSYRTEVERLIQASPQVMFMEAGPATDATFLAELQQLHGLVTIIGTDAALQSAWLTAVAGAIGESAMTQYFVGEQPYAPPGNAAYTVYLADLRASTAHVPMEKNWETDVYAMTNYDAVIVSGLAMIAAHSTDPGVFNSYITKVTEPGSGKVVVTNFPDGERALQAGKQIQYVGAGGPIAFDPWHNSTGGFEFMKYTGHGQVAFEGEITALQIAQLVQR